MWWCTGQTSCHVICVKATRSDYAQVIFIFIVHISIVVNCKLLKVLITKTSWMCPFLGEQDMDLVILICYYQHSHVS